ncbi:hypothetical protein [Paenibacillus sp. PFR10]|nr:hypothetical protein [Paenibacillus sp. PFR10]
MIDKNVFRSPLFQSWVLEKTGAGRNNTVDYPLLKEYFAVVRSIRSEIGIMAEQ